MNNPKINIDIDCHTTRTPVRSPTPTKTTTRTPKITRTITKSLTPTKTATPTPTPTIVLTRTPTNTSTPTITVSATKTTTPTNTATSAITVTPTQTPTITLTTTQTTTPTNTLSATQTPTTTSTITITPTKTKPTVETELLNFANFRSVASWDGGVSITTVGSNGGSSSYGTFDQNGNVSEAVYKDTVIVYLGDSFFQTNIASSQINFTTTSPLTDGKAVSTTIGFRVASINNPFNFNNFIDINDSNNLNDVSNRGSVSYNYKIGKYPVTFCEYVEFLNAVAKTDPYETYVKTGTHLTSKYSEIIERIGSDGNYSYSVQPEYANKPLILVNGFNMQRYCNWLHNNKPIGSQGPLTTETGAYTLNGQIEGDMIMKNSDAKYYIPDVNEWYKAAYYKGGGTNAGYWLYATQSNTMPSPVTANVIGDGNARISNYVCPAIN